MISWCLVMKKSVDGLNLIIPKDVYDPAEDSFLLAENVIVQENQKVLEVGSGSGYVTLFLAKKYPTVEFFCLDINYSAAITTNRNAEENKQQLNVFSADLFSSLLSNRKNPFFDIIIFNSPYLPYTEEGNLERAWAGGKDGLEIVTPFIENLSQYLKRSGFSYLVVSSKTNIPKLIELFKSNNWFYKQQDKIVEGKEEIILFKITQNP